MNQSYRIFCKFSKFVALCDAGEAPGGILHIWDHLMKYNHPIYPISLFRVAYKLNRPRKNIQIYFILRKKRNKMHK